MKKILLALVLIVCIPCYAKPQQVHYAEIAKGFLTGNDYFRMTGAEKRVYVMGSINGMLVAPFFGAPKSRMKWLETCLGGMTNYQIEAILTKYLQDRPEQWHYELDVLTYSAMQDACNK